MCINQEILPTLLEIQLNCNHPAISELVTNLKEVFCVGFTISNLRILYLLSPSSPKYITFLFFKFPILLTYSRIWVGQILRGTIIGLKSERFLSIKCEYFRERSRMIFCKDFTVTRWRKKTKNTQI